MGSNAGRKRRASPVDSGGYGLRDIDVFFRVRFGINRCFFWRVSLRSRISTFPGKSHVRAVAIDASKSLANRRLQLGHASVRSTAQRRDNASNPRPDGARFTASSRQRPLPSKAAASCGPASAPAAKCGATTETDAGSETGDSAAPSRSRIFAGRTTAATGKPQASATMRRLRPLTFLPMAKPRAPPLPVVFADWLSTTPAGGLAARPSALRRHHRRTMVGRYPQTAVAPCREGPGHRLPMVENPLAACATGSRNDGHEEWRPPPRAAPHDACARAVCGAACRARSGPIPRRRDRLRGGGPDARTARERFQPACCASLASSTQPANRSRLKSLNSFQNGHSGH